MTFYNKGLVPNKLILGKCGSLKESFESYNKFVFPKKPVKNENMKKLNKFNKKQFIIFDEVIKKFFFTKWFLMAYLY